MASYLPFPKQLKQDLTSRGWSPDKLAMQLSVDLRTVKRWLAGTTSPKLTQRENLCVALGKKSVEDLGLFAAKMDDETDEKGSVPGSSEGYILDGPVSTDQKIRAILQKHAVVDHTLLFGVDEPMRKVRDYLDAANSGWIVSIHGEGGIGKTALAYEVASRFAAQTGFTRVAWVSAKTTLLLPYGRILTTSSVELRWTNLVKKMADQLGIALGENSSSWTSDFPYAIRGLPKDEKCLLIVDNLETVDDINEVINFLGGTTPDRQIIRPHKILITTRYALLGKTQHIVEEDLIGLDRGSALQLIREEGDRDTKQASDQELQPIIDVTEGNPLLIKLIVTRLRTSHLPLKIVLTELQQIRQQIDKQLIDYLYVGSLQTLEKLCGQDAARAMMGAFCPLSAGDNVSYDDLFSYSGITDEYMFQKTLTTACDLSLIRASRLNCQYAIHSLLWQFICGIGEPAG